jgi:ABC-type multidrug transport system fused ATPase/permease subunit
VVTTAGAAYVFLLYATQLVWTVGSAGFFVAIDRSALQALSTSTALLSEPPPAGTSADGTKAENLA